MSEAEISPSGDVLVEGHHVGELQGFRFTADQSAGGEDAKAVKAAAQKALAAEFEARAERFGACANHDIALGSDGTLRWIGAPIGTLVATEDALKPRVVLLADEQLTGPARDKVAARAERYVEYQVTSLLKPLVDLQGADALNGIARGIAFRLVENFGTLNRRDIAEDIKSLDQEGRAALRRLGVRFGAYHIFVPTLLKPAPAGLLTLLWALKNDGKDKPGFGDVVHALAAGRTSVVVDPTFDREFYKLAGFRVLGRRAVRIDILERLADLIRPALAWRPGQGQRPDGGYDGSGFMVIPPMMSILGANADDMEEILKGLGYRADAKPATEVKAKIAEIDEAALVAAAAKAAAEAAAKAAAQAAAMAASEATEQAAEAPTPQAEDGNAGDSTSALEAELHTIPEPEPVAEAVAEEDTTPAELESEASPDAGEAGAEPEALVSQAQPEESAEAQADATEPQAGPGEPQADAAELKAEPTIDEDVAPASAEAGDATEEAPQSAEPSGDDAPQPAVAEPAEEPKPILIWRPGRFDRQPRHRHDARGRGRDAERTGDAGRPDNRGPRRPRHGQGDPAQAARPEGRDSRPERQRRDGEGNGKERFERKFGGKPGGRRDDKRNDGKERFAEHRKGAGNGGAERGKNWSTEKPREERAPRFDPNSPFAKLAALRDQLKK